MLNSDDGAYFKETISTDEIIGKIISIANREGQCEIMGSREVTLDGVGDSRKSCKSKLLFGSKDSLNSRSDISNSVVITNSAIETFDLKSNCCCIVDDPRSVFIDVLIWLMEKTGFDTHYSGFSDQAKVSNHAKVSDKAIIEPDVEIGAGSIICAGAVIKSGTRIGSDCTIRENAVIGCDGITVYRANSGKLQKFPHLGGVEIGNNTEVGAGTIVSGGILAPTRIGEDVIVGNICNVGHGASIEDGVWMSVGSLVGGHTVIRTKATIAMGVTIRDNLEIGESASLGMGSVVVKSVGAGHSVFGNPAKRMPRLNTGPQRG